MEHDSESVAIAASPSSPKAHDRARTGAPGFSLQAALFCFIDRPHTARNEWLRASSVCLFILRPNNDAKRIGIIYDLMFLSCLPFEFKCGVSPITGVSQQGILASLPGGSDEHTLQRSVKERATTREAKRTAARRVAPKMAWGFVAPQSQIAAHMLLRRASPQAILGATKHQLYARHHTRTTGKLTQ